MAEGDITSWLVKVGDTIAADDPVAEVQHEGARNCLSR
ncbi:biotin/lipoyl-containing protein [Leuconostoc mesenteroides]|nr:biotin/lipoyl-containing protein [Leuconostoc mesenteroides]